MSDKVEPMEDLLEQKRGEREYYDAVTPDQELEMPLTRDGFEALLENIVAKRQGFTLPAPNDGLRVTLTGYLHSLEGDKSFTLNTAGKLLHRGVSNRASWCIDQEIKAKARAEMSKIQANALVAMEAAKPKTRRQRRALSKLMAVSGEQAS